MIRCGIGRLGAAEFHGGNAQHDRSQKQATRNGQHRWVPTDVTPFGVEQSGGIQCRVVLAVIATLAMGVVDVGFVGVAIITVAGMMPVRFSGAFGKAGA